MPRTSPGTSIQIEQRGPINLRAATPQQTTQSFNYYPSSIVRSSMNRLREKKEMESDVQLSLTGKKIEVESIEQLSLVLDGVSEIPESSVTLIQTALEEHTTSVVKNIFPAIHFDSTILLLSATPNQENPKRNLRPGSQEVPSVTIIYNELVEFERVRGTENMKASTLASLAFQTRHDRQVFINKIHKMPFNDGDNNILQSLVGVSTVVLPPTQSPSSSPSKAPVPTLAPVSKIDEPSSKNDLLTIFGDGMAKEVSTPSALDDNVPTSTVPIVVIICWVVIGLGLLGGAVIIILKKRR